MGKFFQKRTPNRDEQKWSFINSTIGKKKSIKRQLVFVSCLLILIPIVTITSISYFYDSKNIMKNTEVTNQNMADSVASQIGIYMDSVLNMVRLMPAGQDFSTIDEYRANNLFNSYIFQNKDFKAFYLVDAQGTVKISTTRQRNYSVANEEWFQRAMAGETVITQSGFEEQINTYGIKIALPYRDHMNNRSGVLMAVMGFDSINRIVREVSIGETGHAYVVDSDGYVIGHRIASQYVMNRYNMIENSSGSLASVLEGQQNIAEGLNHEDVNMLFSGATVGDLGWRVIVEQQKREVLAMTRSSLNRSLTIAVLFTLGSLVFLAGFASVFVKPIAKLVESANKIKDGDLTEQIEVKGTIKSKSEIGQLQMAFNDMASSLAGIVRQIIITTGEVAKSIEDLWKNSELTAMAASEISKTIEHVAAGTSEQMTSVEKSANAMVVMVNNVKQVTENANVIVASTEHTSQLAAGGVKGIEAIKETMGTISNLVGNTSTLIMDLNRHISEIDRAGQLITQISDQTNLLALNAAIEAARAGEHGRGFTVVAEEVRKLAEQSRNASKEIISLIEKIQKETNRAVVSMEEGIKGVEAGNEVINQTADSFVSIKEETDAVAESMKELSTVIQEMAQEVMSVEEAMQEVAGVSQSTAAGAEEVLASVEEQDSAIQYMTTSALTLEQMIQELKEITTQFKLADLQEPVEGPQEFNEIDHEIKPTDDDAIDEVIKEDTQASTLAAAYEEFIPDEVEEEEQRTDTSEIEPPNPEAPTYDDIEEAEGQEIPEEETDSEIDLEKKEAE